MAFEAGAGESVASFEVADASLAPGSESVAAAPAAGVLDRVASALTVDPSIEGTVVWVAVESGCLCLCPEQGSQLFIPLQCADDLV